MEPLTDILETLNLKNDDMNRQGESLHDFCQYNFKTDKKDKTQKIVQKFTSYHMDERIDLFILFELITSLHTFDEGT